MSLFSPYFVCSWLAQVSYFRTCFLFLCILSSQFFASFSFPHLRRAWPQSAALCLSAWVTPWGLSFSFPSAELSVLLSVYYASGFQRLLPAAWASSIPHLCTTTLHLSNLLLLSALCINTVFKRQGMPCKKKRTCAVNL